MNKEKLDRFEKLLNIRFMENLVPIILKTLEAENDYSTLSIQDLDLNNNEWLKWIKENGMTYIAPKNLEDYIEIKISSITGPLFVPKEFVNKVLILGFLPKVLD